MRLLQEARQSAAPLESRLVCSSANVDLHGNGLVIKDLAVLPVMKNSVVFKHLVERQKVATQNIPSVHQAAVNLVL